MTIGKRFIISGAGLVGLLLAQALKSRGIDFVILDRDESPTARENAGWAITLHWALERFLSLIPPELVAEVYNAQVLPGFDKKDTGRFMYINATTGEPVVSIPPSKRLRVRREQIRKILLTGIKVEWGCKVVDVKTDGDVTVTCANGKKISGDVLVGCDGSNSAVRKLILPESGALNQLPVRFCGSKVKLTKEQVDDIARDFDPLLFQGTIPETNDFFWYSMFSTPEYTGEEDVYYAQVNMSWRIREDETFNTNEEKAAAFKEHSKGLSPKLKWLVEKASEDPESILEIRLADWPDAEWPTSNKILLAGDAAHAMTMYRGEAGNHGITDAFDLIQLLDNYASGKKSWDEVSDEYCETIKSRCQPAVLLSRQACLDAHDYTKIRPDTDSPLLSIRKNTK